MNNENAGLKGLTAQEVLSSRAQHGRNSIDLKHVNPVLAALKKLIREPMVILLVIAAVLYFVTGSRAEGIFMLTAILLIAAISLYQDHRSSKALDKLKTFGREHCTVIREGKQQDIETTDVVVGDLLIIEEGNYIDADGIIVQSNDFSVNESMLTGESLPVQKNNEEGNNTVFKGAMVVSGRAIARINAVGKQTKLGMIGRSMESIQNVKTPLELQISRFVRIMAITGAVVFLVVWALNFYRLHDFLKSLLESLTLAMSILPEEIPVAFTTFMALGAWHLMKEGIIAKQMKTVEALGAATVICVDKTGTITENQMSLVKIFSLNDGRTYDDSDLEAPAVKAVVEDAMWASEVAPFDPMEKALHEAYSKTAAKDRRPEFRMVHEYPLDGRPPMMTHVFENLAGERIIAAKGAPEAIVSVSGLNEKEKALVKQATDRLAATGYRLLAVAVSGFKENSFPAAQQELKFKFSGIVAFYDPPKKNIKKVLDGFYTAGIGVKMLTGDNALTAASIARQLDFHGADKAVDGEEIMSLTDEELDKVTKESFLFTRVYPEAKLRIITSLKRQNEVVAMTGDGVNDGPALKAAHIGIAMGRKGSEIAKEAASLILPEDDLARMLDAIAAGRRIYSNLQKAVRYILSIHVPIILVVFIPLAAGWRYPDIFSPVHVIFLELIMGPTCSVGYENEPLELNAMKGPPRPAGKLFLTKGELAGSLVQGLAITAVALAVYGIAVDKDYNESMTRTMVFMVLISANIFLTIVDRSFIYSFIGLLKQKNRLIGIFISITIVLTALLLYVPALCSFFGFFRPSPEQLALAALAGFISVFWYELVKLVKRMRNAKKLLR